MAKKAVKKAKTQLQSIACKHLEQLDDISNAGNPLCRCNLRKFNVSPYNHVCQICEKYSENVSGITHAEMFVAEAAANFVFDMDHIIASIDLVDEIEDIEEDLPPKKKKSKSKSKAKSKVEDDDDDDEDEPVEVEEDEELVIGHEKEEVEDTSYEDEREEGLGKRMSGHTEEEDDEDEELEEELEDLDDDESSAAADTDLDISDIDFEVDVIAKIKTVGVGDDRKEICPYCQKSKINVLRHLSKCKRCPPEIIKAHSVWKKQKPTKTKKSTKKKSSKKSTKKKSK